MDIYTHATGCVRDSMCRVEGKYCDWGCDREKEGKDLFSEKNWFDHFTPSYIQALIHTYTHGIHTRHWEDTGDWGSTLQAESLNSGCWAKRADENNIPLN